MERFITSAMEWLPYLARGLVTSIELAGVAMVLSLSLGLVLAAAIQIGGRQLRVTARTYIEITRGIPGLAMLYIVYFGLPSIGIVIQDAFWAAGLALGLTGAGYMAEIYRVGLESPDRGQHEASLAIGMTRISSLRYVILPQAIPVIMPAATNMALDMLKDTTLATVISTPELMQHALLLITFSYRPLEIYILTALLYLAAGLPLSALTHWLARRARRGRLMADFGPGRPGLRQS